MSQIRNQQIKLLINEKEKTRFNELWDSLMEELNISPKRQSEIIIEGFFQYAQHLLTSYIPTTQTKSQSSVAARKERIYSLIEDLKTQNLPIMSVWGLLFDGPEYDGIGMRTKSAHFQRLLCEEEIYMIYLPYYFANNNISNKGIYLIHKNSRWFSQLKDLCFKISSPIINLTHNITFAKYKDKLIDRLKRKAKYKTNLDKAEKTMLNAYLHEIGHLKENPLYNNTDLILKEVVELRSQLRYSEAQELLQQEKDFKTKQIQTQLTKEELSILGVEE